jgi:uncharacterized protein (TIGR02246 family)
MFTRSSLKVFVAAWLVGLTSSAAMAQATTKAEPRKEKAVPAKPAALKPRAEKPGDDEAVIRASADEYVKAFNAGDAKAVAATWTEDGQFVDENGRKFQGRDQIEKEFEAIFANEPGAEIEVAVESVKFLTPEVALESGTAHSHSRNHSAGPPVAYTAIHVKHDGKWLLSNVNESRPDMATSEQRLSGLIWLVGEWKAELSGGKSYRMTCQWLPEKSFLSRTFTVSEAGKSLSSGTQIIGFDPLASQVVSWTFDSTGGFGHEIWEDRGSEWRSYASSVLPDGATALSTNVLTKVNDDSFTWRSVERSLNDQLLPDTAEVRVERVSQ